MKHKKLTAMQRILINRISYRYHVSEDFLRLAKQKAEESHQATILTQEAYNKRHTTGYGHD